jgi:serine protease Do
LIVKNKIFIGLILILTGFIIGALALYGLKPSLYKTMPSALAPKIPGEILETGKAFSEIVRVVSPAVVNISTTKVVMRERGAQFFDFFDDFFSPYNDFGLPKQWKEQSMGSGVIVSKDGYIITNNHVISDAENIRVTLFDNRSFEAEVVGSDPKTDMAVVKIAADGLPVIPWGDSDKLQVGEFVLAIGNPFSLSHTVTMGIISAVGRANVGIADYEDFIQTDAAINPGNSGGPLVNTKGEIIGINTAIFSRSGGYQGIGFAVPSSTARSIMEQLLKEGKVVRGWVGVTIQELTPELAERFGSKAYGGVLVGDVTKESPAEHAGIKRGDIILEFGGKAVSNTSNFRNMAAQSRPGTKVPVKLLRNGREFSSALTVSEHPRELAETQHKPPSGHIKRNAFSGLSVSGLSKDILRQLGIGADEKGVVVVDVAVGSPAEESGIRRGDVIQEMDGETIRNINDFERLSSRKMPEETVLLYLNRGGKKFFLTLKAS